VFKSFTPTEFPRLVAKSNSKVSPLWSRLEIVDDDGQETTGEVTSVKKQKEYDI
jgi:hypothetical protein